MTEDDKQKKAAELAALEATMHDTEQFHTLDEQVADMKRRGLDPSKTYNDWDAAEDEDWGDSTWRENGKWERKTPADLDENARENWDGDNGKPIAPPFV